MRKITLVYGIAFLLELLDDRRHVDRIPDNDRMGDQIETQGLMGQRLASVLPELSFVGHHQKGP